ncbi:MAG: TIGR02556 family CRISPR-associated protein [Candidatus Atribacteria bacterium]|nr:TIGR02556 family CRISPR-associated protein [Candidatus Atribacteria bacterium]
MLEGIRQIGKTYRESMAKGFVLSLVNEAPQGEEKKHLLGMDFRLKEGWIELSFPEIDERVVRDYLWVGNCKGNIPQDRLTTDRIWYLLSDSLPNLAKKLEDGGFKDVLAGLLKAFFVEQKVGEKTVQVLDFRKIKGFPQDVPFPQGEEPKAFLREYVKVFFQKLKECYGFSEEDLGLFAVTIEGRKPSEMEEYMAYLEKSIVDEQFEDSFEGICYVCGRRDILTCDTARLPDKFYITKLITFSSELLGKGKEGGFAKNFALCRECYKDLLAGMRYLRNYLNVVLAGNTLYLIPGLFFHPVEKPLTTGWMDLSKRYVVSTFTPEAFLEFEEKVERHLTDYRELEALIDYTYVDLLFYWSRQSAFKIKKFIREVPLRRVKEIRGVLREVQKLGEELLGRDGEWLLSLNGMYYLLPVRAGEEVEHRKILDLYERLFLGYPVDRRMLMKFFLILAQVYYFGRQDYNVKPGNNPDLGMAQAILRTQLLLKMFEKLSLIERGEKTVEFDSGVVSAEMEEYVKKMGYSEEETALFLLGYLIGEIGAKQIQGGDSAKKPILGKINFNGMSVRNLLTLSSEVFEKLDQYRIRHYNEKIFAVMKSLMDAHIKDWRLSEAENVYYILSGYAFHTYRMVAGRKREEEEQ